MVEDVLVGLILLFGLGCFLIGLFVGSESIRINGKDQLE